MEFRMTRRGLIAGGIAMGVSACFPLVAQAVSPHMNKALFGEDAESDSKPEMKRVIWHGLSLDIPASLEWNDSGAYEDATIDQVAYCGISCGVDHIVYVSRWQEKEFNSTVWESLLSCDIDTWVGIASNNESILGGCELSGTAEYDNDGTRVMAASGRVEGQREQKRVCSLVTDGVSAWYVLLVLNDGGFEEESEEAAERILCSVMAASEDDVFGSGDWSLDNFVDKYDEPTDERYIINRYWLHGKLNAVDELDVDIKACIAVRDTGRVFFFLCRESTGKFVQGAEGGTPFEGSVRAGNGEEHSLLGQAKEGYAEVWLDEDSSSSVVQALLGGGRVSFLLEPMREGKETYTFSIDAADDFREAYEFIQD